jgi:DNA-binding beta-propeller fold protein YncE/mono/diheme cytochrome c family protein
MKRRQTWWAVVALVGLGCAAEPGSGDEQTPNLPTTPAQGASGEPAPAQAPDQANPTAPSTSPTFTGGQPVAQTSEFVPTDARTPVNADTPPPPISGGTLLMARDGVTAIAADPDRDRVSLVDLTNSRVLAQIPLEPGDEPGRMAEDAAGRVHVALRSGGAVVTIDLATRAITERRQVCGSPRGIAYDEGSDVLQVACMSGELVTLPAAGGAVLRKQFVAPDLRDVVVQGGRVRVSEFRSAKVLELDQSASVVSEKHPGDVHQLLQLDPTKGPAARTFQASLARRMVALDSGRTLVLHERAMTDEINIDDPHSTVVKEPVQNGYGGGDSCQSIVQTAVSVVDATGKIMQSSGLSGAVVPVDIAASPDGQMIVVASAGTHDPMAPIRNIESFNVMGPQGLGAAGSLSIINTGEMAFNDGADLGESCLFNTIPIQVQPTAVAFTKDGTLVVQSREPDGLVLISGANSQVERTISLGGESRFDTGHELFHRDAGGGIACASCHGEGGDDGHVWTFSGLGARRTQSVNVGLAGTEPFHWSGDMDDLSMIMDQVFVKRMGGVLQSPDRVAALSKWLFQQQPAAPMRASNDAAALRGQALFESDAVACASCHSGEKLTNNKSVDVGTGGVFQVPSLVGIAYRAPFIHNGCAATLRDRFDPSCGGNNHGHTDQLNEDQLTDLVAYLETL